MRISAELGEVYADAQPWPLGRTRTSYLARLNFISPDPV
jgi:hypothetical protein